MITKERVKRSLTKAINACRKKLKRPSWLIGFPKEGNPLILSVWELSLYLACFIFFFWLFIQFNHIPHHSIEIDVNKLDAYRHVEPSATDDSLFYLHFQRAELDLTFPLTFERETNQVINLSGNIISDSIQLKCLRFFGGDPFIPSEHLLNKTLISAYWNIVFERAVRDGQNNVLPAPNYAVNDYYYELRDKYNKANSYKALKKVDSCFAQSKNIISIDDKYNAINSYQIKTIAHSSSSHIEQQDWKLTPLYTLTLEIRKGEFITACNQSAQRFSSTDTSQINEMYTRNSSSLAFVRCLREMEKRYLDRDTVGMKFGNMRAFPKDINYGHGWFELYDISQGYYDIKLNSPTIDSLSFKIDFIGAVSYWPSIEPDEKSGTFIKYSSPEKILDFKNNGLKLFFESKELANKQSIRTFAVTAILSGLLIILITFIILVSARYVKSKR